MLAPTTAAYHHLENWRIHTDNKLVPQNSSASAAEFDPVKYWKTVVVEYLCGDITALLSCQNCGLRDKAGPLLHCVMAGIDAAGGCLYGFKDENGRGNSKKRSIRFMVEKLYLDEKLATLIYECVRCGMAHEGITKSGIVFRRGYGAANGQNHGIYKAEDGSIGICVDCFARYYLRVIRGIEDNEITNIPDVPEEIGAKIPSGILDKLGKHCGCNAGDSIPLGNGNTQFTSSLTPLTAKNCSQ